MLEYVLYCDGLILDAYSFLAGLVGEFAAAGFGHFIGRGVGHYVVAVGFGLAHD